MVERASLDIARLGAQGDGIADTPAGPVYVPFGLPGDRVVADVERGRGRLVEVVRASADRVGAPCPHFSSCGGCAAQHMSERLYRDWKREMVRAAFAHRGLDVPIDQVIAVAPGLRRRASLAARRSAGGGVTLGFHEEGTHALVDIAECPVMLASIEAALPALRAIADHVLPRGDAVDDKLRLAVTAAREGLDVALLDAGSRPAPQAQARIADIAARAGIVRVIMAGDILSQSGLPHLVVGGAVVALPPSAFIQATAEAEEAIAAVLGAAVGKARRIADLFCGLGTFTFGLARRARVLAVDGDKAAVAALVTAAKAAPGIKPVETRVRDLMREPLSRTELAGLDMVVLDPPRAGAKAQCEAIAKAKVPVVGAVSCNPATLARDCRILVDAGYRIERVVPVDQFVWSTHVEAVAVLRR
jgi:23S rRNA (uracil1939-C5)-methyltransferase